MNLRTAIARALVRAEEDRLFRQEKREDREYYKLVNDDDDMMPQCIYCLEPLDACICKRCPDCYEIYCECDVE